jgi:hypothetical protein
MMRGQVVGFFRTEESVNRDFLLDHAFITGPDGKGMTDLNSYVDFSGWLLFIFQQGYRDQ